MLNRSEIAHSGCLLKIKLIGFPKELEFSDDYYVSLLEKELLPTEGTSPQWGWWDGLQESGVVGCCQEVPAQQR